MNMGRLEAFPKSFGKNHRNCISLTKLCTSYRFLMTERGDIYLRYPNLDRETVPVYLVQGLVADRGHPPQRTTFCAIVVVNDVNDCHPKFTFPALTNNTVLVRLYVVKIKSCYLGRVSINNFLSVELQRKVILHTRRSCEYLFCFTHSNAE